MPRATVLRSVNREFSLRVVRTTRRLNSRRCRFPVTFFYAFLSYTHSHILIVMRPFAARRCQSLFEGAPGLSPPMPPLEEGASGPVAGMGSMRPLSMTPLHKGPELLKGVMFPIAEILMLSFFMLDSVARITWTSPLPLVLLVFPHCTDHLGVYSIA